MKKGIYLYLAGIFILLNFTACKKYLSEKSNKTLVEIKSLDNLQALLDDNSIMNSETPGFGEVSADDYYILTSAYMSYLVPFKEGYTWRLSDNNFLNDWAYNYNAVYNANYCIDYIEKIPRNSQNASQWDNVKGSALFHRAYRFLDLVWDYGKAYDSSSSSSDLGIVLRLSSDPSIPSKRASVKECYGQVIKDAMESAAYLPNSPQHVMRPCKPAAYGLLARAYLSMRNYDSAYKYADLCLSIKSDLIDYNDPSQVAPGEFTPFLQLFNNEIIFFSTEANPDPSKLPPDAIVDTLLYATYDDNDLRKTVFYFDYYGGAYIIIGNYNSSDIFSSFSGIATDEMYLIRAEGNARKKQPDISAAMNDLNTLLIKRWKTGTFTPFTVSDQQQAINLILLERRKELIMRGLRWIDIKRLNKEGANITLERIVDQTYTLLPNSNKYALPLPKDIIGITGMPQNPGW